MRYAADVLNNIIPISDFTRSKAGRVFGRVRTDTAVIVVKSNVPIAVMVSSEEYDRLSEDSENLYLMQTALERLAESEGKPRLTHTQLLHELGAAARTGGTGKGGGQPLTVKQKRARLRQAARQQRRSRPHRAAQGEAQAGRGAHRLQARGTRRGDARHRHRPANRRRDVPRGGAAQTSAWAVTDRAGNQKHPCHPCPEKRNDLPLWFRVLFPIAFFGRQPLQATLQTSRPNPPRPAPLARSPR